MSFFLSWWIIFFQMKQCKSTVNKYHSLYMVIQVSTKETINYHCTPVSRPAQNINNFIWIITSLNKLMTANVQICQFIIAMIASYPKNTLMKISSTLAWWFSQIVYQTVDWKWSLEIWRETDASYQSQRESPRTQVSYACQLLDFQESSLYIAAPTKNSKG